MTVNTILYAALQQLDEQMQHQLLGTHLEAIKNTIHKFALYSAIAGVSSNILPGIGGIAAIAAQTTLVWTMYIKINRHLGISMTENTMKFVGSAMLTNIATNAGSLIVAYAASAVLSWIPFLGQAAAALTEGALGYIVIYVAAALYVRLLTKVMKAGDIHLLDQKEKTNTIIQTVVTETDIKDLVKEAKDAYKKAKASGEIDAAKRHARCPHCDSEITIGQKFCSNCGRPLL